MQIGDLKIANWTMMAPMAGITNLPFRLITKRFGAGLVFSEMISANGLALGSKKTLQYLESDPRERPFAVQIFGSQPEVMVDAAKIVIQAGADLIDINMGCPARKVVKTGAGGALLRSLKEARRIISAVRHVCTVPLTVKIRSGWSPQSHDICEIARMIEASGADGIIVHPRFVTEGFSGQANWNAIARVKDLVEIPVIGNGDVFTASLAFDMREKTGCDGVMIGRGAVGNPWIFEQIQQIENGVQIRTPEFHERRALILEHFRLLARSMGEYRAAKNMRGLVLKYIKGMPDSKRFRAYFTNINDTEALISAIDRYSLYIRKMQI